MQDLANDLGLDKSTVSLALRGSSRISEKTRQRVLGVAREHGYRPNLAARMLASGSAQVVGLVLPEGFAALRHEVVVASVQGLARMASEAGVLLVVVSSEELAGTDRGQWSYLQPDGLLV